MSILGKILCEFGFHDWSAPFSQRHNSCIYTLPGDMVCVCIREGCKGKQLFLDKKWITIHN